MSTIKEIEIKSGIVADTLPALAEGYKEVSSGRKVRFVITAAHPEGIVSMVRAQCKGFMKNVIIKLPNE